jgi:hypothetical protein
VTLQVPGSEGQSASPAQIVMLSLLQYPWRQSSFDRQVRRQMLQMPWTPPMRQLTPLSQSTPHSVLF